MNSSNVEEVKNRADIVDVIGSVVTLKKGGANYKGLCPFHSEKTPSFSVSQDKQFFTCFGCGEKGDVIEFVKKYYNLEFREALEKLADQYGVTLSNFSNGISNKEEFFDINRKAAIFYFKKFRKGNNPGYKYMRTRGISDNTMHTFGIGYADSSWDSLYNYLLGEGIKTEKMLELGLISESKGKYFDKFRNRVIFPIKNTAGKVIGFGGRIVGEGNPKYLNSQETPVFQKKNNLYGLFDAKEAIKKADKAILVEGYMDVIALYDRGIKNVSASLGTALTENQCALLKRFSSNIVLAYDADDAGQKAATRGIEILNQSGAKGRVLEIPEEKDPDDFIKKNGPIAFNELVDRAKSLGDYTLSRLEKKYNLDDMGEKVIFLKEVTETLVQLRPIEQDMYIKKMSKDYDISEEAIKQELKECIELKKENRKGRSYQNNFYRKSGYNGQINTESQVQNYSENFWSSDTREGGFIWGEQYGEDASSWAGGNNDFDYVDKTYEADYYNHDDLYSTSNNNSQNEKKISKIEIELLRIVFSNEDYFLNIKQYEDFFQSAEGAEVMKVLIDTKEENHPISFDKIIKKVGNESKKVLETIHKEGLLIGCEEEVLQECIKKIKKERLKDEEKQLLRQLELLEKDGNEKIEEINDVSKKLMVVQRDLKLRR